MKTDKERLLDELRAWNPPIMWKDFDNYWAVNQLIDCIENGNGDFNAALLLFLNDQLKAVEAYPSLMQEVKMLKGRKKTTKAKQGKKDVILHWLRENCPNCTAKEMHLNLRENWHKLNLSGSPPSLSSVYEYRKLI